MNKKSIICFLIALTILKKEKVCYVDLKLKTLIFIEPYFNNFLLLLNKKNIKKIKETKGQVIF